MKPYILFEETIEDGHTSKDFKHETIDFYRWLLVNRPDHSLVNEFNGEAGAINTNTLKRIPYIDMGPVIKHKKTRKPKKVS